MPALLFSAPEEYYTEHIEKCLNKFYIILPIFYPTLSRILDKSSNNLLKDSFYKMIKFHDLGKLTKKWQENVGTKRRLPSHSTLGAAFLWQSLPDGIKEPISFSVSIHHTDRGLLGDNIEKPDVQAIMDGIVDLSANIKWHNKEIINLDKNLFPPEIFNLSIYNLKDMARGLRIWAKGCGMLEQHKRRIEASLCHHILKLCDISAAVERKEYKKEDGNDLYGGWLMVDEIKKYMDGISNRTVK